MRALGFTDGTGPSRVIEAGMMPSLAVGARDYRRPCSRSSWAGRVRALTVAEHGLPSTTPVSPANSPGPTVPSTTSPVPAALATSTSPSRDTDPARREADLAHTDLPEPAPAAPGGEGPIGSTPDEGGAFPGRRRRPACPHADPSFTLICIM